MISRRFFFCSLIPLLLGLFFTTHVNAAAISNLSNIDVNGTLYNVTFHASGGKGLSFNEIWDANGDGIFGNDSSVLNRAPTFWGDFTNAQAAHQAVMLALGDDDYIEGLDQVSDAFWVTWDFGGLLYEYYQYLDIDYSNYWTTLTLDVNAKSDIQLWASFEKVQVPTPTPVLVFAIGLAGMLFRRSSN